MITPINLVFQMRANTQAYRVTPLEDNIKIIEKLFCYKQ